MSVDAEHSDLRVIPVALIDPNPDNPRVVFRSGEVEKLQESIAAHGVQVPVSVYKAGKRFVLILREGS
jgi:ParB family chromosome partitioning protein